MTPTFETRGHFWQVLEHDLVIAELGVFMGKHASVIYHRARPSVLHLVDRWEGMHTCCDSEYQNPITIDLNQVYEDLKLLFGPAATFHRQDTIAWLCDQPVASLDVAYLDSDHAYEHVATEIELCRKVVKPGGWISGHDYNAQHFPGVVRAVDELRAAYPDAEFHLSGELLASWFLRLPA